MHLLDQQVLPRKYVFSITFNGDGCHLVLYVIYLKRGKEIL